MGCAILVGPIAVLAAPLLTLGIGLVFAAVVAHASGILRLAWRASQAAATALAGQVDHPPSVPAPRPPRERPMVDPARRARPRVGIVLLLPVALLALGVVAVGAVRGCTPGLGGGFVVANTAGEGVYLRRAPHDVECRTPPRPAACLASYVDDTRLVRIGRDESSEGWTWRHVRAPDGREGWVLAEHTVAAR